MLSVASLMVQNLVYIISTTFTGAMFDYRCG